jgi:hypothetical protein
MMPLPLPTQTLTWLTHAEQAGQRDAQVMMHLLNRADANDQDVAKFLEHYSGFLGSYSKNIAALCRRLEALERAAGPIDARGYEGPTDEDLYSLAEQFHGDPVPAMRRALELWGNPLQGASAPGENLATAPGEADIDHVEQLAAIIRKVDGNHSIGAAALAEAILERYPCAFLIDPPATPPAPVAEFDDQQREAVYQAVAEALGSGAYDCLRVWSAWSCGTMGPGDFVPVAEDSDRVAEIADAAIEAIRAIPAPALVPVGECPNCGYEGGFAPAPQAGEVGP